MKLREIMKLTKIDKPGDESNDTLSFRALGDENRDAKKFAEASEAYEKYLASHPDDFGIWVQRGNCLKDSGDFAAAKMAYESALRIKPEDADIYLQMGHLMKLSKRLDDAIEWYTKSFELNPTVAAAAEIRSAGGDISDLSDLLAGKDGAAYFLEIDDFLNYLKAHPTLSGIQRVQAGLIKSIGNADGLANNYHFIIRDNSKDEIEIKKVDTGNLIKFINFIPHSAKDHYSIREFISKLEVESIPLAPRSGDIYCILGAFWGFGGVVSKYNSLKDNGVKIGVYLYDIIPITHPEYCDRNLSFEFLLSLGDGLAIFDFIFAISDFTAQEIRRLQKTYSLPTIPVLPIPLAHVLTSPDIKKTASKRWGEKIRAFDGTDYVLFVSTIEGRKNHLLIVRAWQEMIREGLNPPDLVFVGRTGWRIEALIERLQSTNNLGGVVHIVNDVSDVDLATLYRNCLFTVFPSYIEGWGLPVGESLVAGRPCVASNTSSIPEVGGDFVDYIDPYDLRGTVKSLKTMCFDKAYRDSRASNIASSFKARTWSDVGANFVEALKRQGETSSTLTTRVPFLEEGELFQPSTLASHEYITESYTSNPTRLFLKSGWHAPENFGVWMKGRDAEIEFSTSLPSGEEVVVFAEVVPAPSCMASIVLKVGQTRKERHDRRKLIKLDRKRIILSNGRVGEGGILKISFIVEGDLIKRENDNRVFLGGLCSLSYASSSNVLARLSLVEKLAFEL